jgi:hypothetical protein
MGPAVTPSFARDFPKHAALESLVEAFARGNYARVRAEAPKLASSAESEEVRRAAQMLLERTKADPLAVGILALAGALLVLLFAYWAVYGKAPPNNVPPPAPVERVH